MILSEDNGPYFQTQAAVIPSFYTDSNIIATAGPRYPQHGVKRTKGPRGKLNMAFVEYSDDETFS